ncbi:hypothetical protein AVEN_233582-1 [Araneus ventricosus]|uniref:Uncharacterized protein n=1 Tax=Araneus ventricosus TaxID=182803 RepID=A0A4Y2HQ63_ARAVE|nr:hypothetical protein AVEN_233582-1 [Araneus ventricosus]
MSSHSIIIHCPHSSESCRKPPVQFGLQITSELESHSSSLRIIWPPLILWATFYSPAMPHLIISSVTGYQYLHGNSINIDHPVMGIATPSPSVTIGGSSKEPLSLNRCSLYFRGKADLFTCVSQNC